MFKHADFKMGYVDEVHSQVLELPYVGEELSMTVLLPDDNTDLTMVSPWQWVWVSMQPAWALSVQPWDNIWGVSGGYKECWMNTTACVWWACVCISVEYMSRSGIVGKETFWWR